MELGFAEVTEDGSMHITNDYLMRVFNVDDTCLALDGGTGWRGGYPTIMYCGRNFPDIGKAVAKSFITATRIAGSKAAGETIPPHLQFSTTAQSKETIQLHTDM